MLVRDRMSAPPITVDVKTSIAEAQALMRHYDIRRVPVVAKGRLVGIVSWTDLMRAQPSPASALGAWEAPSFLRRVSVKEIMTVDPLTIAPDAAIEAAAVIMRHQKIGGLPVVADGVLLGIITESDIFEAFVDLTGFRRGGARFVVDLSGQERALARIAEIAETLGVALTSLATYQAQDRHLAVLRISSDHPDGFAASLGKAGFQVVHLTPAYAASGSPNSGSRPQ
jgi:acetoin utilization protein AcuB